MHLIAASDRPWLHALLAERNARTFGARFKRFGIVEEISAMRRDVVELCAERPRDRASLLRALLERGHSSLEQGRRPRRGARVPTLTAAENITLPCDLAGTDVDRAWFGELAAQLGIADRLSHRPRELSGGQQQRIACARALVSRPELIFADEPTGNLDSNASAELLAFLRRAVSDHGQSIVMVTHDPRAAAYADRVVFLADGRVVRELDSPTADSVLETMKKLGD